MFGFYLARCLDDCADNVPTPPNGSTALEISTTPLLLSESYWCIPIGSNKPRNRIARIYK
jgi:hypothetical protein